MKSCGPDAPTLASSLRIHPQVMVARKPGRQGEHEVSRKAIAQGMSDCLRCPVCSCAHSFVHTAHEIAGAACTRHSLCPLLSSRAVRLNNSDAAAPRESEVMSSALSTIGSKARCRSYRHYKPTGRVNARPMTDSAKQSISRRKERMDCFVANAPRNDVEGGDRFTDRHCERSEAIHLATQRANG